MALTERVREADSVDADAEPHFLGTVITKRIPSFKPRRHIDYWSVVDGQQRLTTLQLLMAAARAAFIQHSLDKPASMLSEVLAEADHYVGGPGDKHKIRHKSSKRWEKSDYAVFRTIIDSSRSEPSSGVTAGSPLGDCYNYFHGTADAWLRELSEDDRGDYVTAFTTAVLQKLVVADIRLSQGQNSHAIFEALNARGKPLTEWEKTKNYILSPGRINGRSGRRLDLRGTSRTIRRRRVLEGAHRHVPALLRVVGGTTGTAACTGN